MSSSYVPLKWAETSSALLFLVSAAMGNPRSLNLAGVCKMQVKLCNNLSHVDCRKVPSTGFSWRDADHQRVFEGDQLWADYRESQRFGVSLQNHIAGWVKMSSLTWRLCVPAGWTPPWTCVELCCGFVCNYGDCLFSGDNLDKQLVRYQRRRKGQVIQPFQGDGTDCIHSQDAASMSPPSDRGSTALCLALCYHDNWYSIFSVTDALHLADRCFLSSLHSCPCSTTT